LQTHLYYPFFSHLFPPFSESESEDEEEEDEENDEEEDEDSSDFDRK
jgi:hypothetical protein